MKWPNYILLTQITESVSIAVDVTTPILLDNLIMVFTVINNMSVEIFNHTQYLLAHHRIHLSSLPWHLLWVRTCDDTEFGVLGIKYSHACI